MERATYERAAHERATHERAAHERVMSVRRLNLAALQRLGRKDMRTEPFLSSVSVHSSQTRLAGSCVVRVLRVVRGV